MQQMIQMQQGYQQVQQGIQNVQNFVGMEMVKVVVEVEPWSNVKAIKITQRFDGWECLLQDFYCCEGENVYDMASVQEDGRELHGVGTITEKSNCCLRCLFQQARPFNLEICTDISDGKIEVQTQKSCGLTYTPLMCVTLGCMGWCCNGIPACRPEMQIFKQQNPLGRVSNPHRCMGRVGTRCCPWENIDVYDQGGSLKYMISADCCQSGQVMRAMKICRCCNPVNKLRFQILDANFVMVGEVENVYNTVFNECFSKMDQFIIHFPMNANYNDKLLLINTVIMIDFDIFEDTCCRLA